MNPTSLLHIHHLPVEQLPSLSHEAPVSVATGAPAERHWALAMGLVAMCAAVAFALPV